MLITVCMMLLKKVTYGWCTTLFECYIECTMLRQGGVDSVKKLMIRGSIVVQLLTS